MFTVLLSGGSGKRLWPLSNDLRSKQYIKIFKDEVSGNNEASMVQRVIGQLKNAGFNKDLLICAGKSQVEIIRSQLNDDIGIVVEPERRDTFPAVALSCAYAVSECGGTEDDSITLLPVDPYTESGYFSTLASLPEKLNITGADIVLMGAVPNEPSTKYGYILPDETRDGYFTVKEFKEKPDLYTAKQLINSGAVFNCGVFCFKIGLIMNILRELGIPTDYNSLYNNYELLPKISFDYQVLEKCNNMIGVPFNGMWKDLGTWNAIADEMSQDTLGYAISESCINTKILNELDIPIVADGLKNVVIAASADGIVVTDKQKSEGLKDVVAKLNLPPMYEERRWGTLKTVSRSETSLTRQVIMFEGMNSSYHYHKLRNEVWVILKGRGEMILGNMKMLLTPGMSVTIPKGTSHMIKANSDIEFLEIHIGNPLADDIHRLSFDWDEAESQCI